MTFKLKTNGSKIKTPTATMANLPPGLREPFGSVRGRNNGSVYIVL